MWTAADLRMGIRFLFGAELPTTQSVVPRGHLPKNARLPQEARRRAWRAASCEHSACYPVAPEGFSRSSHMGSSTDSQGALRPVLARVAAISHPIGARTATRGVTPEEVGSVIAMCPHPCLHSCARVSAGRVRATQMHAGTNLRDCSVVERIKRRGVHLIELGSARHA